MLPYVSNGAFGGGVQLAAFVQQQQEPGGCCFASLVRGSCNPMARAGSVRPSAAAACGLLVMASAYCPPKPRSGRLQACASKRRTRRRGSRGGSGDDEDIPDWPFDGWNSLQYGGDGGSGNWNGGSGWGWGHHWGSSGDDAFHRVVYHGLWVWQVLCAASLLRSVYFLLFAESVGQVNAAAGAGPGLQPVAMAC